MAISGYSSLHVHVWHSTMSAKHSFSVCLFNFGCEIFLTRCTAFWYNILLPEICTYIHTPTLLNLYTGYIQNSNHGEFIVKKNKILFAISSRDLIGSIWRFSIKSFPLCKYQLLKPKPFKGKGHSQLAFTITFTAI